MTSEKYTTKKNKHVPRITEFVEDFAIVLNSCNSKINNAIADQRLKILENKF
jgi:hypothetical protein